MVVVMSCTKGTGFTVNENVCGVPVHVGLEPKTGVTVTLDTIALLVLFMLVNEEISPVPDAPRPVAWLSFVQLNTVPETAPVNTVALKLLPAQTTRSAGSTTDGTGLTVTTAVVV